jgi:hypothetical protein
MGRGEEKMKIVKQGGSEVESSDVVDEREEEVMEGVNDRLQRSGREATSPGQEAGGRARAMTRRVTTARSLRVVQGTRTGKARSTTTGTAQYTWSYILTVRLFGYDGRHSQAHAKTTTPQ